MGSSSNFMCGAFRWTHPLIIACGLEAMFGLGGSECQQSFAQALSKGTVPGQAQVIRDRASWGAGLIRRRSGRNSVQTQLDLADSKVRSIDEQMQRQTTELKRLKLQAVDRTKPLPIRLRLLKEIKAIKARMEASQAIRSNILQTTAGVRQQQDTEEAASIMQGLRSLMKTQLEDSQINKEDMESVGVDLQEMMEDSSQLSSIVSQPIQPDLDEDSNLTEEELMAELDALVLDENEPPIITSPIPQTPILVHADPFPRLAQSRPAIPGSI